MRLAACTTSQCKGFQARQTTICRPVSRCQAVQKDVHVALDNSTDSNNSSNRRLLAVAAALLLHVSPALASSHEISMQMESDQVVRSQTFSHNASADLAEAGFMGFGGTSDGSNPFTVYGFAIKKYVIEILDGDKIVSRKRGFTVESCATIMSVAEEDAMGPRFQGLPTSEKVRIDGSATCKRSEGSDLRQQCSISCESTCNDAVEAFAAEDKRRTGIDIADKDLTRVTKRCIRDCRSECAKPGKVFDFVVPSRQ